MTKQYCPICRCGEPERFYTVTNIPKQENYTALSQNEAVRFARRDINLVFCHKCGFIFNDTYESPAAEHVFINKKVIKISDSGRCFYYRNSTLSYLPNPLNFVLTIRNSISSYKNTKVVFHLPNIEKFINSLEFWNFSYEQCSYFSTDSIYYLLKSTGFNLLKINTEECKSDLTVETIPLKNKVEKKIYNNPTNNLTLKIKYFENHVKEHIEQWKYLINSVYREGKKIVIWGVIPSTSTFINTLGITDQIRYVVTKERGIQGRFIPGGGQKIISYDEVSEYKPDLIIAMVPEFLQDIQIKFINHRQFPEIIPVDFMLNYKSIY